MKISLRLRLTLLTSLLLTLMCAAFTLFSIYNANSSINAAILTSSAQGTSIDVNVVTPMEDIQYADYIPVEAVDTTRFSITSLWFMAGAIVVCSIIMYFVSGIILRPLQRLSKTIASVDQDALDTRIEDCSAGDELTMLSGSFNQMLERLHGAFLREQRFSADAAHELKTPLAVIKTNIDVLGQAPTGEEYAETLAVVKKQADRMAALVQQLQELSSMERSQLTQRVDLAQLVNTVVKERCPEKAKVNLTYCTVRGDSLLLKQAISNLVDNAIKYGGSGLEAELTTDKTKAVLVIKDNGPGIGEEDREKIFQPFYRVDKSRSRSLGGSGLGLAITADIVKLHGGSITCSQNHPTGAVFRITLPV